MIYYIYTFFHNLHKVLHLLAFHKHPFEETVRDRTSDNLLKNQNYFHCLHNLHNRKACNASRNCQSTLKRKIYTKFLHFLVDFYSLLNLHLLFQYLSHHLTWNCLLIYGVFPVFTSSCLLRS